MSRPPPVITKIDVTEFEYTLTDMGAEGTINLPVASLLQRGRGGPPRARPGVIGWVTGRVTSARNRAA